MPRVQSLGRIIAKIRSATAIAIEEMERRVLLSASPVPAIWSGLFTAPLGAQYYAGTQVAATDPQNGDLIVAYEGDASSNPDDADMIVSAYKPNESGGWQLDTTFGGQNDDPRDIKGT